MGFRKPDLSDCRQHVQACMAAIKSPYNDGYTSMYCKKDLWQFKCWLDREYTQLPKFADEHEWEKELLIETLARD